MLKSELPPNLGAWGRWRTSANATWSVRVFCASAHVCRPFRLRLLEVRHDQLLLADVAGRVERGEPPAERHQRLREALPRVLTTAGRDGYFPPRGGMARWESVVARRNCRLCPSV